MTAQRDQRAGGAPVPVPPVDPARAVPAQEPSRLRRGASALTDLVVGVVVRGQRDSVTGLASQFAYNAFIATVPLLLIVLSVFGLVAGKDASTRIVETYQDQIPVAYQDALGEILRQVSGSQNQAVVFLLLGAGGALYLVGNAIGALMVGLDRARDVPHRSWLHTKVVGIKFAAIWSVLMTAVNALLLVGQDLIAWATERWGLENDARGRMLDTLFPLATVFLLAMVWVLYRYAPNAAARRLMAYMPGILVAAIGILGFTQGFGWYVTNFSGLNVYGTLLGVVVYLTFLWGVGVALLGGAEVNEELVAMRRGRPTRRPRPPRSEEQD